MALGLSLVHLFGSTNIAAADKIVLLINQEIRKNKQHEINSIWDGIKIKYRIIGIIKLGHKKKNSILEAPEGGRAFRRFFGVCWNDFLDFLKNQEKLNF